MEENDKELLKQAFQGVVDKYAEAQNILEELAEKGSREAMFMLSKTYVNGCTIPDIEDISGGCSTTFCEDKKKAKSLLQQSADLGYPPAQCRLGEDLSIRAENLEKAFILFKSAAEQGYARAMYRLFDCYWFGNGTEENHDEAISWCKKAAEKCYPHAEYNLAKLYRPKRYDSRYTFGSDEPDLEKAFYWYKRAAEHGLTDGLYSAAICLLRGEGTEKNEQEAIEWLKKAAKEGFRDAINKLRELGITW